MRFEFRKTLLLLATALALSAAACGEETPAGTAEQRELGHADLRPGLEFELTPGVVSDHDDTSVEARAATPLSGFSISSGPEGADQVEMIVSNIHREAQPVASRVTPLGESEMEGCTDGLETEAVDCEDEPDGDPGCRPDDVEREDGARSRVRLTTSVGPCQRISYRLELDEETQNRPLRLAAVGRTTDRRQLERSLDAATEGDPDYVLLLGDNAPNASLNGLRELDLAIERSDYPAVVAPGEGELIDGSRAKFLEIFGPYDLRWELLGVHQVAFYSADGGLGDDGLRRLERAVSRPTEGSRILAFTHRPPLDPTSLRDDGFNSEVEGARTLSVLTEHAVDTLFVGHVNEPATEAYDDLTMHLTSAERAEEYLWVEVDGDGVEVERRSVSQ